jgi:glycosyltransferase involved in cell wall biosynthesis
MVLGLSQALAAQGVEVTILTTPVNGDAGQPPLEVPLNRPIEQEGYQIRYFPCSPCSPFRRYKFSLPLLQWLSRHANEFDLAHIHALFSPVSTAAAAIARSQKLPYILRPLGTLDPADLQKKRHLKQLYAILFERANIAQAAAIHFTSDQEAKISHRFGAATQDLVIPLGVTPSVFVPALSRYACPTLLFMSRLDRKKGLDLLLPALEQLTVEGLEFHWILAGSNAQDPAYEQQIQAQIQASPLAGRTTIAGFVSGAAKTALLQQADLFVLPSYYENFGIAVAEAMAAGIPVVISDQVHIWPQVQQSQAGWICSCNVNALVEQLRIAIQSSEERIQRGKNARAYAIEHFSWEAIAQQTVTAYQQILCSSAHNASSIQNRKSKIQNL